MARHHSLKDRVAQAYHDYGRLCSAHPIGCLLFSIISILVLSYPAIPRFKLPDSSPIDVYWTSGAVPVTTDLPEWLKRPPVIFIQQIIVRGRVEPWNSIELKSEQAVRGPLSRAFVVDDIILNQTSARASCFHASASVNNSFLPHNDCLLLSPTAFWKSDISQYMTDPNVLKTIFTPSCTSSLCVRDILLGMPTGMTGIKKSYQTNRKRSIDYSISLFLAEWQPSHRQEMKDKLDAHEYFSLEVSRESDEETFVHVFYRPKRYFANYFPLMLSYVVFMLYLYYSARKFEMVASRWGLAFAAAFTVAATLMMTTGICSHLDLTPTLWSAEIFPYIALILGLENTLCITRSVVNTPPSLDVSSRISYGLSHEGYSLFKYFVLELTFLAVGYSTQLGEIQEFCSFAAIGLVVDFYMQLFFYAPCLTFDLQRLNKEERNTFAALLFSSEVPLLKTYPPVSCPFRRLWPRLFEMKRLRKRTLSDSQLNQTDVRSSKIRRSTSVTRNESITSDQVVSKGATSARLWLFSFVTRTRIMQRSIMVVFVVWTIWLAFVVHSSTTTKFGISHRVLETAPQAWGDWQRRTFKWWPVLFSEYNISLSGHYLTFLPPIVLSTEIGPKESILTPLPSNPIELEELEIMSPVTHEPDVEISTRVSWLETQLKMYFAAIWLLPLTSVIGFIIYACFWSRWKDYFDKRGITGISTDANAKMSQVKAVDYVQSYFCGHRFPIERVVMMDANHVISVCQEGNFCLWNVKTGERKLKLNRQRGSEATTPFPQIWSVAVSKNVPTVSLIGCCDGSLEVACLKRNKLIGIHQHSRSGICELQVYGDIVVAARIDGSIDFLSLKLTSELPTRVSSIVVNKSIGSQQKPISQMILHNLLVITTSCDNLVKVYDISSTTLEFTLDAHNSNISSLCVDDVSNTLFSGCDEGIVCWWNLVNGRRIRTVDSGSRDSIMLTVGSTSLLGLSTDGILRLWNKNNGLLLGKLGSNKAVNIDTMGVTNMSNRLAVTFINSKLYFWDISDKILISQVNIGTTIQRIVRVGDLSVLCQCGTTIYRVALPIVKLD